MSEQTLAKSYRTQKLPGEPIILVELFKGYTVVRDLPQSGAESMRLLNALTEPVFYIVDTRALRVSVNDVIDAAHLGSGSADSLYRHPMIRAVIFVSELEIVALGVQGLDSDAFGHIKARVCSSVEDALAYARTNV